MSSFTVRELYQELRDHEGSDAYDDILQPFEDEATAVLGSIDSIASSDLMSVPEKELLDELWELYAWSRVSDLLLLRFQEHSELSGDDWRGPNVTLRQRNQFFLSLGMRMIESSDFHPFFHEIVQVDQSDDPAEPITLIETIWPGFMFGDLLFCRAGVRVRGGTHHIRKDIAERSILYFAFLRRNRPYHDLSQGWGSNSQWRTSFRRDYQTDAAFHYHVDGELEASAGAHPESPDELDPAERVELVVNRCFIRCTKPDAGWPYCHRHTQARTIA